MTEEFAPRTIIDHLAPPVRLLRGAHQYFIAAGIVRREGYNPDEALTIRYGWDSTTCIDPIDEFNAIGRWQIRFASMPFGLYLLWLGALMPVEHLSPLYWPAVGWLAGQIALLTAYDPIMGFIEVIRS